MISRTTFVALLWPLLIELGLGAGLSFYATNLAARLSDQHAAAMVLGNQLASTTFVFLRILGAGISVVVAQHLGAGHTQHAALVARQSVVAASWGASALALLFVLAAGSLLQSLNADANLIALATAFIFWLAPGLFLDALNAVGASVLRAHLKARESMMIILVMHATHALLAWPLMKVHGLPGFAMALLVSRIMGCLLHYLAWRFGLNIRCYVADFFKLRWQYLRDVFSIGVPAALENIAYQLAFVVSISVATKLGTAALATHAYVWQTSNLIVLFGAALGICAEVLVARLVGQQRFDQAQTLVNRVLVAGLTVAITLTVALAFNGHRVMQLFTSDPQIIAAGAILLWLAVLLEIGRTFNLIVINALRGAGDVRYPVQVGITSVVLVLAGGSYLLGLHWGYGLVGLWVAYAADEWIRGLMMWRRWHQRRWLKYAQRRHAQVMGLGTP